MKRFLAAFFVFILYGCSGYQYMGGSFEVRLQATNAALAGEVARSFEETTRKRCVNGVAREEWHSHIEKTYDTNTGARRYLGYKGGEVVWVYIRGKIECRLILSSGR